MQLQQSKMKNKQQGATATARAITTRRAPPAAIATAAAAAAATAAKIAPTTTACDLLQQCPSAPWLSVYTTSSELPSFDLRTNLEEGATMSLV